MHKILSPFSYKIFFLLSFFLLFISCDEPVLPKPKAYLSLEYPKKEYKKLEVLRPYSFDVLKSTTIIDEKNNWLKITYPNLNASIDITYRPIENNLKELLIEAEKLVFKHAVKAEQIVPKDFVNPKRRVFGSLF